MFRALLCAALLSVVTPAQSQTWKHLGSLPSPADCVAASHHGESTALLYVSDEIKPGWILSGAPGCSDPVKGGRVQVDAINMAPPLIDALGESASQPEGELGARVSAARSGLIALASPGASSGALSHAGRVQLYLKGPGLAAPNLDYVDERYGASKDARFGYGLDVDGDLVAVGSPGPDSPNTVGRVDVWRVQPGFKLSWVGGVVAPKPGFGFGKSVVIRDEGSAGFVLLVGAPDAIQHAGRVFAYASMQGALKETAQLVPNAALSEDGFGTSLDIDEEHVFIGAPGRTKPGIGRTGSVVRFKRLAPAGYQYTNEFFPSYAEPGDACGTSVAVADDWFSDFTFSQFIYGCPGADLLGPESGAAHVTTIHCWYTCWIANYERLTLPREKPAPGARFGAAVAIASGHTFIGAPGREVAGMTGLGSVEEFRWY